MRRSTKSESQAIGERAEDIFGYMKPPNWSAPPQPGSSDYGIDYLIQVSNDCGEMAYTFYAQLKGSKKLKYSKNKSKVFYPIETKNLNYFKDLDNIVMVIVVDVTKEIVYYKWLDDDFYTANEEQLRKNRTITVSCNTYDQINNDLDIRLYLEKRKCIKFKVCEIKKNIRLHNFNEADVLDKVSNFLENNPQSLSILDDNSDAPWISLDNSSAPELLRKINDLTNCNKLTKSKKLLEDILINELSLNNNERAELFLQMAKIHDKCGETLRATDMFCRAAETCNKKRYRLKCLEYLLNTDAGLAKFTSIQGQNELNTNDEVERGILAKYLTVTGQYSKALDILHPHGSDILIKLLIASIVLDHETIGTLLETDVLSYLKTDRQKFAYYVLLSRYKYISLINSNKDYSSAIKNRYTSIHAFIQIQEALNKAWFFAKELGYPANSELLFDVSVLVYFHLESEDGLLNYLNEIKPLRHSDSLFASHYIKLLFYMCKYDDLIEFYNICMAEKTPENKCLYAMALYSNCFFANFLQFVLENRVDITSFVDNDICISILYSALDLADKNKDTHSLDILTSAALTTPHGDTLLTVFDITKDSRNRPRITIIKELDELHKTNKLFIVSKLLFYSLDAGNEIEAKRAIDVSDSVLGIDNFSGLDNLHLADCLMATNNWTELENLSRYCLLKNKHRENWQASLGLSLYEQGRFAEASIAVDDKVTGGYYSILKAKIFILSHIGMLSFDKALEKSKSALIATDDTEIKQEMLGRIIRILSRNSQNNNTELKKHLLWYGDYVDRNNENAEASFIFEYINHVGFDIDILTRCDEYVNKFPNSKMLMRVNVYIPNEDKIDVTFDNSVF